MTDDPIGQLTEARARIAALEVEVDESRRSLSALERQRDFVTRLLDTMRVIVVILDRNARIVDFNAFMEELSGYRLDEVQGRDWFETFLPPRDHARIQEVFANAVGGVRTRGVVNPILTKKGEERDIEWHDTTLTTPDGEIEAIMAIGIDVTERTGLQREREVLHARLEDALAKVISGYLPICSGCKKIRDKQGVWNPVEAYVRERTGAEFTHSLCPSCIERLYPKLEEDG